MSLLRSGPRFAATNTSQLKFLNVKVSVLSMSVRMHSYEHVAAQVLFPQKCYRPPSAGGGAGDSV